jgi:hypothetical protein
MKILFALVVLLNSCSFNVGHEKRFNSPINYIESYATLRLETINTKCGEWGGNKEVNIVYRDLRQETFYADYIKEIIDCEDPYADSSKNIVTYAKRIEMDIKAQLVARKCINQLVDLKLSERHVPVHSGIYNSVFVSDSSLILEDYPSRNWESFFELRDKLINN